MASMFRNSFIQDPLQGCPTERMAEEVRCPLCQGLLKRAASLSCNHVFCNSCILRYIKIIPACPVCKMPAGRREVLFTPHMDNLVNIYRSVEMAAGVNLFESQPATPLGSADNAEDGNEAELDCLKSPKRKSSPESPKWVHKKVKGSGDQNHKQKQRQARGAVSKAFCSENSPVLNNFDDSLEAIATGNSITQIPQPSSNVHTNLNLEAPENPSTQNSQPLSNVDTNFDLEAKMFSSRDAQNPSGMLNQSPRCPRACRARSKVEQTWTSSLACNWVFCCSATDDSEKLPTIVWVSTSSCLT